MKTRNENVVQWRNDDPRDLGGSNLGIVVWSRRGVTDAVVHTVDTRWWVEFNECIRGGEHRHADAIYEDEKWPSEYWWTYPPEVR